MKLYYATDPDTQGRHLIYYAVWDRDVFSFEHTTNIPLSEMDIDEVAANAALCRELRRRGSLRDAAGNPKHMVVVGGNIVEKDAWEAWIDPEDGSKPPTLGPATYSPVTVAVDAAKARLEALSKRPILTTEEKDEALGLMMEKQATRSLTRG